MRFASLDDALVALFGAQADADNLTPVRFASHHQVGTYHQVKPVLLLVSFAGTGPSINQQSRSFRHKKICGTKYSSLKRGLFDDTFL